MLDQILINLVQNADQALSAGQGAVNTGKRIELNGYLNAQSAVIIEVNDSGQGIPDDIRQRIFVPFFTTKSNGSGVGLALTRQVMVAHGGSVSVDQSELGGARFRLIF